LRGGRSGPSVHHDSTIERDGQIAAAVGVFAAKA